MSQKYRVTFYVDGTYDVWNLEENRSEYQGSLADCDAWIRLQEGGYL